MIEVEGPGNYLTAVLQSGTKGKFETRGTKIQEKNVSCLDDWKTLKRIIKMYP